MTEHTITNEEFYANVATVYMANFNNDPSTADEKSLSLVHARFEDSEHRAHAITEVSKIIAERFETQVEADMAQMTEQEELPLAEPVEVDEELVKAIPNAE